MAVFTAGGLGVDFDLLDLGPLILAPPASATPTSVGLTLLGTVTQIFGSGFTFGAAGPPTAGTINRIIVGVDAGMVYDITGLSLSAATFRGWVATGDNLSAKAGIFGAADQIIGSAVDDRLRGFAGDDTITGGGGQDSLDGGDGDDDVYGGLGNDIITEASGSNYLRGDEGDDSLVGGTGFDDINGNMGSDTVSGGLGDDWVVGGRDNDLIFGDDGIDLVYGNLGDDSLNAGAGADTLRGGQGNDTLSGGAGNDYVSGDRGDDTMTGGDGADLFHAFADAGIDRVLDFNVAQGDRVILDVGTTFSVTQVGGDTVIMMTSGQVILVGVPMSSLTGSSIFLG